MPLDFTAIDFETANGSSASACSVGLVKVRDEHAEHYVTFHHKGIIHGRDEFVRMLDSFHSVIGRRHDAMLGFLSEPRSIDDLAEHRFVYRPHVESSFVEPVEHRTADLHIRRMLARGEASEVEPGRFQRA